ncbi:MAG TPA: hypothetical protein PLS83_06440, partial [Methanothrix soehngenii]|nr:hypothetical protein [Methanothrix soehngenii]
MKLSQALKAQLKSEIFSDIRDINVERRVNLSLYDEVLNAGKKIRVFDKEVVIPRNTALVMADLAPQCNWAHPCQYRLYD